MDVGEDEVAQDHREDGDLRHHRDVAGDRCRCRLVDVGRPHVEWHQREFEANGGHDHGDPDQAIEIVRVSQLGQRTDAGERHGAKIGIDQRHAEQQEGGGGAAKDEIFGAGLGRVLARARIGDQAEQRDTECLEPEEKRGEVDARRQQCRAEGRNEQKQIVLVARRVPRPVKVREGQNGDDHCRAEHQSGIVEGGAVDDKERCHRGRRYGCRERQRNAA